MKIRKHLFGIVLFTVICSIAAIAAPYILRDRTVQQPDRLDVVCTTTHLSVIVDALGDGLFETHTVIPYGMCPGHFDLSPSEAMNLLDAPLILYHGYEQFLAHIDSGDLNNRVQADVEGNWMVPDVQIEGVCAITDILSGIQPDQKDAFAVRAGKYIAAVTASRDSLLALLSDYRGAPVISAAMNRPFAEWTGLHVLADFPRDEDMSIAMMQRLLDAGRAGGVRLVIDNVQSSGKIGRTIAENLGVPLVVLTNFPDPKSDGRYPYVSAFEGNCSLLLDSLADDERIEDDGIL